MVTVVDVGTYARGRHRSPRRKDKPPGTQIKQGIVTNPRFSTSRMETGRAQERPHAWVRNDSFRTGRQASCLAVVGAETTPGR